MQTTILAIDIAKENFYIYGINSQNKVTMDKAIGRKKLMSLLSNHKPLKIFMEACGGSNYLCKRFTEMGHEAKRISAQHVKPYVGRQKNDRNDAKAILEASQRPEALFVAVKVVWQQDLQCLHKIREQKVKQYKATVNQVRGLLFEYGIVVGRSVKVFKECIPQILEDANLSLNPMIREEISELFNEFKGSYEKVKKLELKLDSLSKSHNFYKLAQEEINGVGPLTASRFLSVIGHHSNYKNGRQVSAALGLVPRQSSSGGKSQLGSITKTGDIQLRSLLFLGASASLARLSRKQHLTAEELKLKKQIKAKGHKKVCIQLANRNARQMWAIMKKCS